MAPTRNSNDLDFIGSNTDKFENGEGGQKRPIEVHDFRVMSNQQKQFGMSIDVRVSREGTVPVSIPGEKESTVRKLQSS